LRERWGSFADSGRRSIRGALASLTLIEAAEQLGDDALMDLVGQVGRSADWFEGLHKLQASAECRIMCAYAAPSEATENGDQSSAEIRSAELTD